MSATELHWRKSTACTSGECVEVAYLGDRVIVRNSGMPWIFLYSCRPAWQAFIAAVGAPSHGARNRVSTNMPESAE